MWKTLRDHCHVNEGFGAEVLRGIGLGLHRTPWSQLRILCQTWHKWHTPKRKKLATSNFQVGQLTGNERRKWPKALWDLGFRCRWLQGPLAVAAGFSKAGLGMAKSQV